MKAITKNNSKKICIGVLLVGLIATLSIGGTLAYLTDQKTKVNTFSMGDLEIELEEPSWDDEESGRELLPGDVREKDPTVIAVEGDSYMRVVMTIKDTDTGKIIGQDEKDRLNLILQTIYYDDKDAIDLDTDYELEDLAGIPHFNEDMFVKDEGRSITPGKYYYNYIGNDGIFEKDTSVVFFNRIVIPCNWDAKELEKLGEYQIVIHAEAIQVENIDNSKIAFDLLDKEFEEDEKNRNDGEESEDYDVASASLVI